MIEAPPVAYAHPYWGTVVEHRKTREEIEAICGPGALACTMRPTCHIWLPMNADAITLKRLREHELAHCKGWPSNHPRK